MHIPLPASATETAGSSPPRKRGWRTYENGMVALFTICGGVSGLDALAIYFLMPFVMKDLHLNNAEIGILSLAVLLGWAISSLSLGLLSDRLGRRKPFLIGCFICFALLSGLSALAHTFVTLFIARLLMGLAEGPVIPIQQAIISEESSPHRRGLNMGLVQNFGAQLIGALLGPLIMVQLALTFDWRAAFLIAGAPGLLMAWLISRYVRERTPEPIAVAQDAPSFGILSPFLYRNVQVCAVIASAAAAWFYLLVTFLPLWLVREGLSPREMSVVMSAVGLGGVISSIIVPLLSDRYGRARIMALAALTGAIAPLAALYIGPNVIALAFCTFAGCMMVALLPLCATVALEAVPPRNAATASAIVIAVSTLLGGGAGPLLGGFLADRFGLGATMWTAMAMVVIALAACPALQTGKRRETEARALPA